MKAVNLNSTMWLNYWRHGVFKGVKEVVFWFVSIFGVFCCFAAYYKGILVSWFQ
jgi:hypothetical protein